MLINSGMLLDHFARLAAHVTGSTSALVTLAGRRDDGSPRHAAYGLSREEAAFAIELATGMIGGGAATTIIADLTCEATFARSRSLIDHHGFRFFLQRRLVSAGGDVVGCLCLVDRQPRDALTEEQAISLDHIASMILVDRQREQRHLHLMRVSDRAMRIDRILHRVSDAVSCADALVDLLEELCKFHNAASGWIWELAGRNGPLAEVSRYPRHIQALAERPSAATVAALSDLAANAIRVNEPHAAPISRGAFATTDVGRAIDGHVCVPIWVQQQRFGISLAFAPGDVNLDFVVADLASLADTIRPSLFRKVTEERVRFVAYHDHLTQLGNRLLFQENLREALAARRVAEAGFALLYLDLDGFKVVNDTRGHEMGDEILVEVARRLQGATRVGDTIARMGGDEFAIIQPTGAEPGAAVGLADRLLAAIAEPFDLAGRRSSIGVSIGIAFYPQHGDTPDLLLRNADVALYRSKNAGRNTYRIYDPLLQNNQTKRYLLEQDLRDAIDGRAFTLAYQPVCHCASLHVVGFEALLRWSHPSIGPVQPEVFIPLAERTGLVVRLGRFALETACQEAASWGGDATVSVNLSPVQFREPDLPRQIADVLSRTGLPPGRLDLEVTEGMLLEESDTVLKTMHGLQEQGIRITLDDFGTAYASLSYLRRFPFNGVKIDKSFIRGLCDDTNTHAIVRAVLSLGEKLNLAVVAEGVESERELNALRKLGCRYIQGFLSGRPTDSYQARALLRKPGFPEMIGGVPYAGT